MNTATRILSLMACLVALMGGDVTDPALFTAPLITRFQVDAKEWPLPAGLPPLTLPPGPHRLEFKIESPAGSTVRLRHRFKGIDDDWRDISAGMRFSLRFQNAANDVLDFRDWHVQGNSTGWTGDPNTSPFHHRREVVAVPADVERMTLLLVSGGPSSTVGTMVVDDIVISRIEHEGDGRPPVLFREDFERGVRLESPEGTPEGWQRAGLRRDLLKVVNRNGNHAIAAFDNQTRAFGEWSRDENIKDRFAAGDSIAVEWDEMYSIGDGGSQTRVFVAVPPGQYAFEVMAIPPCHTEPAVMTSSLAIVIPSFFWQTWWFSILVVLLITVVVILVLTVFFRMRMRRHLERIEWLQAVERERARIARDMHDDLGAGLTRIAMLGASVRRQDTVDEICTTACGLVTAMDEIVWAVNPRHDTLDSLAAYLGKYAQDFLGKAGLRCRLDIPFDLPERSLAAPVRHGLFLAFKEALNNIVRHALAHEVHVTLECDDQGFILTVRDDGRGFNAANDAGLGDGLGNMRHRIDTLGGRFEIESAVGAGTSVCFHIQLSMRDK